MAAEFEFLGRSQVAEFNSTFAGRVFQWRTFKTASYVVFKGTTRVKFVVVLVHSLN